MKNWFSNAIFYHIYPLGLCGAPLRNDFNAPIEPRMEQLYGWLEHIQSLEANTIYLGPLFESSTHGYDTADYYHVDRRLGSDETLAYLSKEMHERGQRLVLDGVFNHVGRDFWAFRDVLANRERSAYRDWFANLRFDQRSPYNDPFSYEGWNGHFELVKLNLCNPSVKEHLFGAIASWIKDFKIDGLRLDAADSLDFNFIKELAAFCHKLRPDFWLMGEVIHGDYRRWVNSEMLDSVTNYEVYKSLYSSHIDHNYFEIAYALNRQFGPDGVYQGLSLYAFADNHDVNRVASSLTNAAHLYPLYCLLFSLPGVPSIYYGSEWGISGKRTRYSDLPLRPQLNLEEAIQTAPQPRLPVDLARLAGIRKNSVALREGNYEQLLVQNEQLVFTRQADAERVIVAVNAAEKPVTIRFKLPAGFNNRLKDLLNPGAEFQSTGAGELSVEIPACWGRFLKG
ncbi:MAG TPA: alpha-amylase family glycosyl hydrolase [Anaerolineaceae bacterium]|nr:alpha-amylase family glycosyl hydrolase [Anaerolineaceae bacterium]